ncbi:MAG: nucleotidyltransferase family protein [Oscillospiraceae bacterium]|jgi:predicted nucleotidyltransferase|nr:nucleotidyltransferase family protein [Oscillospiraceae bacterium]
MKISENTLENRSAAGVICELNPPHAGHSALFRRIRAASDAPVVCVMSGNFVQRGEPAVFPKLPRAECAVLLGADLVIELPVSASLSSAEGFAEAGAALLASLGVNRIAFGCESGELPPLTLAAEALNSEAAETATRRALAYGKSYAAARGYALREVLGGAADVLREPNNTLAVEYIRAVGRLGADIAPLAFPREPGYSSERVRSLLLAGDRGAWDVVPPDCAELLRPVPPVFPGDLETALLSRLRALSPDGFSEISGGSDGLAERAAKAVSSAATLGELLALTKTRRHAMSRVKRYMLAAALGLRAETLPPQYIRPLALSERGGALLKRARLPVISRTADVRSLPEDARRAFALEAAATDFYTLGYAAPELRRAGSELRLSPKFIGTATESR